MNNTALIQVSLISDNEWVFPTAATTTTITSNYIYIYKLYKYIFHFRDEEGKIHVSDHGTSPDVVTDIYTELLNQ
jgi:hypothetical protein